jgi:hypothetical protein
MNLRKGRQHHTQRSNGDLPGGWWTGASDVLWTRCHTRQGTRPTPVRAQSKGSLQSMHALWSHAGRLLTEAQEKHGHLQ